jgi:transcriptional regulator with XRE-family HTH domain
MLGRVLAKPSKAELSSVVGVASTTRQVAMSPSPDFAARLRWWRRRRGISQLELAGRAAISQRHLSFLELDRAAPSRAMVLRLAAALEVPLRQQNALLLAAGFAPVWLESELAAPALAAVRSGLDYMLAQQEPFPAVVVDRRWNLLQANAGAVRMVEFLVGPPPPGPPVNLADALVGPDVLRPYLVNWPEVVGYFLRSIEADAATDGSAETALLLERLLAYPGVDGVVKRTPTDPTDGPVLPMRFRKGEVSLSLFTTIATLGTPQDVTLQELRIECFFPMDEQSAAVLRSWAAGPEGRSPARR